MGGGLLFSQYGLLFAITHTSNDGLYEAYERETKEEGDKGRGRKQERKRGT